MMMMMMMMVLVVVNFVVVAVPHVEEGRGEFGKARLGVLLLSSDEGSSFSKVFESPGERHRRRRRLPHGDEETLEGRGVVVADEGGLR